MENFCDLVSLKFDGLAGDAAKFSSEEPDAAMAELHSFGRSGVFARGEVPGSNRSSVSEASWEASWEAS